ncbi:tRNA-specific adenosine deaminase subunit TAD2 [Phyllosticta citricarpa]|uniref:tRNA-specific adenosine deaminase subunit TAD2 n=1 Tax=Phyllosticta citricarpa TaxID=55181 RepID=A0ABR1L3C4_9PEZI
MSAPALQEDDCHQRFMREALRMAELALATDETPVGCVFVHDGTIIGRGMNDTNRSLNGTRHAEFVAISQILARYPPSVLRQTDLYVTVEPCVMCASALRQFNIRAVYFGCWNDSPSVDKPYPVYGGIFREEAIMLLRKFYVQQNTKAPEPKHKGTRVLKTEILPLDPKLKEKPSD